MEPANLGLGSQSGAFDLSRFISNFNFWPFILLHFLFQPSKSTPDLTQHHVEASEACPVRPRDISPRFIVHLPTKHSKHSGKNMKLRKSRFRFGSFAFGHSTTTHFASTHNLHSPPSLPTYTPTPDPFFVHPELRLKEDSKFRSSSTASLIRRSNSR